MVKEGVCSALYCRREVSLLDGRKVLIRPICYDDRVAILALFNRLSPETRLLRFHYVKPELPEDELRQFCDVDYEEQLALVAEIYREGTSDIVGVGRYYRLPDNKSAEVAFVVEDREQMKGIGTHLLKELAAIARTKGINTFTAEMTSDNVVMLNIFRKYNPGLRLVVEYSTCQATFSVQVHGVRV